MRRVSANEAKTRFGALLSSVRQGPVEISRRGAPAAYLISPEAFKEFVRLAHGARIETVFAGLDEGIAAARSGRSPAAARILRSLARHWKALGIR